MRYDLRFYALEKLALFDTSQITPPTPSPTPKPTPAAPAAPAATAPAAPAAPAPAKPTKSTAPVKPPAPPRPRTDYDKFKEKALKRGWTFNAAQKTWGFKGKTYTDDDVRKRLANYRSAARATIPQEARQQMLDDLDKQKAQWQAQNIGTRNSDVARRKAYSIVTQQPDGYDKIITIDSTKNRRDGTSYDPNLYRRLEAAGLYTLPSYQRAQSTLGRYDVGPQDVQDIGWSESPKFNQGEFLRRQAGKMQTYYGDRMPIVQRNAGRAALRRRAR